MPGVRRRDFSKTAKRAGAKGELVERDLQAPNALCSMRAMLLRDPVFRKLCRARDLLCEEQEQAPAIEAVARAVGISPAHFIRQFEAVFGETPHQFRIRARLERAKRLLVSGGYSVTEVCMELGFSSLGSFSTMFARRVGETPSGYRRRRRTLVAVPAILPWESIPGCFGLMAGLPAGTLI